MFTLKSNSRFLFLVLCLSFPSTAFTALSSTDLSRFYITPGASSQCHKQPTRTCLTLQQFVESDYYGNGTDVPPNLSLVFLPGNHTLSSEFSITNMSQFMMSSETRNSAAITCSQFARFSFDKIKEVKIIGVQLFGCGDNKVVRVNNFSLIKSNFSGKFNSRTALIINKSTAVIEDCTFENNTLGIEFAYNNTDVYDKLFEEVHVSIAGAMYITHSNVTISRCLFDGNSADNGGALYVDGNSSIFISECNFINNKGSVIYAINSCIKDRQSIYNNNTAHMGAVVYALQGDVSFNNSKFYGNVAENKSGVALLYKGNLTLDNCEAIDNSAYYRGGVIHHLFGTLTIKRSKFIRNKAQGIAAVVEVENCTKSIVSNSWFSFNEANKLGVLHISKSELTFINTTIENNSVAHKGVIYAQDSFIESRDGLSVTDNDVSLGIVYLVRCRASFDGKTAFIDNSASFIMIDSNVSFTGNSIFESNSHTEAWPLNGSHRTLLEGGAITSIQSILNFYGQTTFKENYSKNSGGAVYAAESAVSLYDDVHIEFNRATSSGGAIYLYRSTLFCEGNCSIVGNRVTVNDSKGGGVHAISSSVLIRQQGPTDESEYFDRKNSLTSINEIYSPCTLMFENNSAHLGGGLYFEADSKLYILGSHAETVFKYNTAQRGGAMFINDGGASSICKSEWYKKISDVKTECFFQKLHHNSDGYIEKSKYDMASFLFENNSADAGSILFGGLLDRCTVSQFSDLYYKQYEKFGAITNAIKGFDYFKNLSNLSAYDVEDGEIASDPVRICFCDKMQYNSSCSYQPPPYEVMKGENFTVSLVAVDQVNRSIATVAYSNVSRYSDLGEGQREWQIGKECTNWTFSIISEKEYETLKIHAEGPCHPEGISTSRLEIKFKDCHCPIGFEVMKEKDKHCLCKCDSRLKPYLRTCVAYMNNSSTNLERKSNVWIGYFEKYAGYVIYPHCPFDYCRPPVLNGKIELNFPNGSDTQCDFNRTGLLCGSCPPNFSLSIGSSLCMKCNSSWPAYLVLMIVSVILFGIILVVVILVLDLTVATGTINGFLFYVNVVGSGSNAFLRLQNQQLKILKSIIKFLNITLGFDACFSKKMDSISQTWLGLSFPSYVFAMIIIVIILSKYSRKFSQVLGKGNPVAALATLMLLFYAKLLRNTITIFSFAIINYPNNSTDVVWSSDASVKYFQGHHIPLFLVGVLIIVVIFIYTVLLFSWQWLLPLSNKRMFRWVQNTRLNLFMEANLAPYKPKYRFWTGLLLFVRIILHIVTAINFSNIPQLNLLSVGISVISLIMLKAYIGNNIYKKVVLDYLEFTFYFNIVLLTVITSYYFHDLPSREAVSTISVSIALVMFMGILVFHIVQALRKIKCVRRFIKIRDPRRQRYLDVDGNGRQLSLSLLTSRKTGPKAVEVTTPTSTVVTMSPQHTSESAMEKEDSWSMNDNQRRLSSSWLADDDCS